tara:strand:- start:1967 stop:2230 length:264 start_codon:yes stop_codon:yes gene_type:complete
MKNLKINKELSKLIEEVEILKDKIDSHFEELVDDRINWQEDRSEKWQESERAQEFEDETSQLEEIQIDVNDSFDTLLDEIQRIEDIH